MFTVGRCAVPLHTDEFSGALSLNLREQGLQSGGKQLGKTAADCNHLLTVWPVTRRVLSASPQTDSIPRSRRISMVQGVLSGL